jgi:uncharacterized cupredoxin-like copper-binding protein
MTATIEIPQPPCQAEETDESIPHELRPAPAIAAPPARQPKRLSWDQFLLSQLPLAIALALVATLVGFAMLRALPAGARWPGQQGAAQAAAPGVITTFSSETAAQQVAVTADPAGLPKWTQASYEAKAGDVTFVVANPGPVTHNFKVEGPGVQAQSPTFAGKTTQSYTIKNLPPGEGADDQVFAGHREAGMVAKLTVK